MKAGAKVNDNLSGGTLKRNGVYPIDEFINQSECFINVFTRYNWTDAYSALNADVKKILDDTCSCLAAIYAVSYDMGGYNSRVEAEDVINVLRDGALRNLSVLKDKKNQDFMVGA